MSFYGKQNNIFTFYITHDVTFLNLDWAVCLNFSRWKIVLYWQNSWFLICQITPVHSVVEQQQITTTEQIKEQTRSLCSCRNSDVNLMSAVVMISKRTFNNATFLGHFLSRNSEVDLLVWKANWPKKCEGKIAAHGGQFCTSVSFPYACLYVRFSLPRDFLHFLKSFLWKLLQNIFSKDRNEFNTFRYISIKSNRVTDYMFSRK